MFLILLLEFDVNFFNSSFLIDAVPSFDLFCPLPLFLIDLKSVTLMNQSVRMLPIEGFDRIFIRQIKRWDSIN